jgi:beta-hydroxyacyl-ACP dehydratase FabZ
MAVMETTDIMEIIPHRYPFLLVDKIVEMDAEACTIVGIKNLTFNELFFQGHFPGNPVMPGVLQLEAMAQVAGVMLNSRGGNDGKVAFFMSINNAKFRRIVRPGDTLRIEIVPDRIRSRMASVKGKAYVGDELASEADLMFGYGSE